jgi:hypothetical protein
VTRPGTRDALLAYAAAWRAGDVTALLDAYADDVAFHYFGATDLAGDHVGKDAAVAAMAQTASRAKRELVEIVDVLAGDVLGSIVVVERFTREGVGTAEVRRTAVYRVGDDGRIVECWMLDEDPALMDRFWAP